LSTPRAGKLAGISQSRLQELELARQPLTAQTVRAVLHTYGVPEEDAQSAFDLVPPLGGEHRHQVATDLLQRSAWVAALQAAAKETVIVSNGPLAAAIDVASPATPAEGRTHHHGRTVLLLHETLLGHTPEEQLAQLADQIQHNALAVRFIPAQFAVPVELLTEWTLTAWGWDGTAFQRRRRQLYVTHASQRAPVGRNGQAAVPDRQLIQAAVRHALPAWSSALRVRQALQAPGQWRVSAGRHSPAGRRPA
jgi:hypothetical protein